MTMASALPESSEPTRTCVGCRARHAQSSMLRYGLRDGLVAPRVGVRATGRSAYLCPQRRCFEVAIKRRAVARALAGPRGRGTSITPVGEVAPLWRATIEALETEINLLRRCAQLPQAHARLTGLEKLLFELSSHTATSDSRASAGTGGSPTHG